MTRVLFDTSVLVAAMLEEHPHHSECFAWLQRVKTEEIAGFISTHRKTCAEAPGFRHGEE